MVEAHIETYKQLINETLPRTYTQPVRANHCFARIVLDWLFKNCWYNHLSRKTPAFRQLSSKQLAAAIGRMQEWLTDHSLLVEDNIASLKYRGKWK